jgi:hypothetical protein
MLRIQHKGEAMDSAAPLYGAVVVTHGTLTDNHNAVSTPRISTTLQHKLNCAQHSVSPCNITFLCSIQIKKKMHVQ